MSTIHLRCSVCHQEGAYSKNELAKHLDKRINITCKHCKEKFEIAVDHDLLTGRKPKTNNANDDASKPYLAIDKLARLIIVASEEHKVIGHQIILEKGENILGRKSHQGTHPNKRAIPVKDRNMGRLHCILEVIINPDKTYRYVLKDNNSCNGTLLRDTELDEYAEKYMALGDVIQMGDTQLQLQ